MSFGILYEGYSKGDAFCDYKHEKEPLIGKQDF